MTEQSLSLMTLYKGWDSYQRRLVAMIEPLTSEQLALPIAPNKWSIGMVAQHMVSDRVWWFYLWMGEGSPDLASMIPWNPGEAEAPPTLDTTELIAGFESTWSMIAQALECWTPADLGHFFAPPTSLSEAEQAFFGERSLQWILWHAHEHEIHHGGELSLALGNLGLPGIYGNA